MDTKINVIPSKFTKSNTIGDFNWMIQNPEYSDSLFIFNDNEEQFISQSNEKGGGNAIIRPYQCLQIPRSIGVPTGTLKNGGYKILNNNAKIMIDFSIDKIKNLLKTGNYKRVFYSSDGITLGTGIFSVGKDVKDYIRDSLINL